MNGSAQLLHQGKACVTSQSVSGCLGPGALRYIRSSKCGPINSGPRSRLLRPISQPAGGDETVPGMRRCGWTVMVIEPSSQQLVK